VGGAAQSMDTGREKEESENEESEEEMRKVEQRMQERAKKTILILQNKFQGLGCVCVWWLCGVSVWRVFWVWWLCFVNVCGECVV